jgi:hypothetical protein
VSTIVVSPSVADRVELLARAWDVSPGEVVERLLTEFKQSLGDGAKRTDSTEDGIPIHLLYRGAKVEAVFDRGTQAVTVKSGSLAGHRYRSPSGAAVAVIASLNPDVKPNRNGWGTWVISGSGNLLHTLRK